MTGHRVLALDIDGVLLDPERGGAGPWDSNLLEDTCVDPVVLHREFFVPYWSQVVSGALPLIPTLDAALKSIGSETRAAQLVEYWLASDFCPRTEFVHAAQTWVNLGAEIVLVSNQEPIRGDYLLRRLHQLIPFERSVLSSDIGVLKGQPEFYKRAMSTLELGAPPLLIDDSEENCAAASAADWMVVQFKVFDHDLWGRVIDFLRRSPSA
jgi:FMN phosphatase YigB (HAD superfamily)